jgi:cell division protein FtsQ
VIIEKRTKKQNRRASTSKQRKHQHLLDVKVRAKKAVAKRTQRVFFSLCALILIAAASGAVAFGAKGALNALFFSNPDYSLKTVDVSVDGNLNRDTVLRTAQISVGQNVFSIDLPKLQDRLATLPQVEESHVRRILPDKLVITIQERRPVAWVVPPDTNTGSFNFENAYMVDRRGILLKTKSLAPEYLGLPLIVGVDTSDVQPGQLLESDEVKAALDLIRADSEILRGRLQIQSIDVSKGYALVVTDRQHASVTFGPDDIEWQLKRLETIMNFCDQNNRELQTVNLMVQRNVPVTFVPPAAAGPEAKPPERAPETAPPANSAVTPAPRAEPNVPRGSRSKAKKKKSGMLKPLHEQNDVPVRRALPVSHTQLNG